MLTGTVILVTGASRGIGKGIATVFVEQGAKVYITGRRRDSNFAETKVKINAMDVMDTARDLCNLGPGICIGMYCDHRDDEQVKAVFDKIKEEDRRLDILVNNVFGGLDLKKSYSNKCFWDIDPALMWDKTIDCGLRAHYVASCYAIRTMVTQHFGLIVNISSEGGRVSMFTPLYGIAKEADDRMASEFNVSLKQYNICAISLWPGAAKTEVMKSIYESPSSQIIKKIWHVMEDTTLTGKVIVAVFNDPSRMKLSGKVHMVALLSHVYGIKDVNGRWPYIPRSLKYYVSIYSEALGSYIPSFIRIPQLLYDLYYSRS